MNILAMSRGCAVVVAATLLVGCSSVGLGISIPVVPGVGIGVGVGSGGVNAGVSAGRGPVSVGVGVNQSGQVTGGVIPPRVVNGAFHHLKHPRVNTQGPRQLEPDGRGQEQVQAAFNIANGSQRQVGFFGQPQLGQVLALAQYLYPLSQGQGQGIE